MAWQVTDPRITPPHIPDPESGDTDLWYAGKEDDDLSDDAGEDEGTPGRPNWDRMAKDAFRDSTTYVDTNYRKKWEDSLRAFNNEHPQDSKYNMDIFRKRAHTFVPKTRAVIRKNEAAAAAAFFSNLDTVSIQAKKKTLLKFGDKADLGTSSATLAKLGSGEDNETYVTTNAITSPSR